MPHRDDNAVANACIEILTREDPRCDGEWLREQGIAHFGMEEFQRHVKEMILGGESI